MPIDAAPLRDALAETAAAHGPGLVGLVTEQGEPVFEEGTGVADLDTGRPPTADDRFRIGSITKTYVSALLVQLLREGAFARTDTVERWLPGLVPGGDELTVELLLRMRSGLPDYVWPLLGTPPDLGRLTRYFRPEELVEVALAQPDRHPPGDSFRYCNTDYVLLGLVAEKATGTRVDALLTNGCWRRWSCTTPRSRSPRPGCTAGTRPGTCGWRRARRTSRSRRSRRPRAGRPGR